MAKNKEKPSKTITDYRRYRNIHYALKATEYVAPFAPFGVMLGLNWNTWFPAGKDSTSVAVGLVMAIASLIMSVLAIAKKDSAFMKKVGAFIPVAVAFLGWGLVCVLLSNILMELGKSLMCTGAGIIASATADVVDKEAVGEKYLYLKSLCDDNGLSKEGEWREKAKVQAEKDAEQKRVRYVPHD